MKVLCKLEKVIEGLEKQKDALIENMQAYGWEDDRLEKKIHQAYTKNIIDDDFMVFLEEPERRMLPPDAAKNYQCWYSACRAILEKNQPSRLTEFDSSYAPPAKSSATGIKQLIKKTHLSKNELFSLIDLIKNQFDIVSAIPAHIGHSIYDVELDVYSVLMADELVAAQYLLKNGFLRAAGALAGIILERHLKNLLRRHSPPIKYKEKITLAPLNDLCKDTVYDVVIWQKVKHLVELRNLCSHDKDREPTKSEIVELINGTDNLIKTKFL